MIPLLNTLSWIFGRLPMPLVQGLGRGLGNLTWLFSRRKREVRERIMECLGVDESTARGILRRMYRNHGMTAAEFLHMPYMSEAEAKEHIDYRNVDGIRGGGDGFIAMVAHTGNWEFMAAATSFVLPKRLHVIVKALKPEALDLWVKQTRTCWGAKIHDRRGSSRELLKVLKSGENLAFILDQNTKRNWGVFVDFFGKPACTSDGLANLAAISDYPIHPVFCRRDPKTRKLIVEAGEKIESPRDRSPEEILRVTQACTTRIEEFIRNYPDEWIWMHRRWRTRPEEENAD